MFPVLFADRHLVVIDKPAGTPVTPARGGGDSIAGQTGALVCHRLDTDTSGVLVLAKTAEGQTRVNEAFSRRTVLKTYRAVCVGAPPTSEGRVDVPLGDWHRGRVKIGRGRPATTAWRLVATVDGISWMEAEPETGRTHQIRAHLTYIGLPLVGDEAYGGPRAPRVMLHALRLVLPWPGPADRLVLEAPLPPGFTPGG